LIGFLGIEDPVRPESEYVVGKVQNAGIIVRMVTGDSLETAVNISKQCGILPKSLPDSEVYDYVMEGRTFYDMVGGLIPEYD